MGVARSEWEIEYAECLVYTALGSEALCESSSQLLEAWHDARRHGFTITVVIIILTTTLLHGFQTEKENLV